MANLSRQIEAEWTIKYPSLYLKINEKTIYKLAKCGKLPGVKIGGTRRFKKEAIDN